MGQGGRETEIARERERQREREGAQALVCCWGFDLAKEFIYLFFLLFCWFFF